jgi:anti-sigma regulatory factor (Ser/Thr protein kinase)
MKFTTKGHIKIIVLLIEIHEKDAIKISVEDTGFGIKKKD